MKVYIAEAHTDLEGFMIAGVFMSKENAVSCLRDKRYETYDELVIEVFDVNKSYDSYEAAEETITVRLDNVWKGI